MERRPIPVEELSTLDEAAACGTAAVICPISKIVDLDTGRIYDYGDEPGPVCRELYAHLTGIQSGRLSDRHGWLREVDL